MYVGLGECDFGTRRRQWRYSVINALDITKVERIIGGLDAQTPGADANQDGNINALDITKIERIIAGLD